jgi:hypothetical protein
VAILLTPVPSAGAVGLGVHATPIDAAAGTPYAGTVAQVEDTATLACPAPESYTASVDWADATTSVATVGPPTQAGLICTYPVSAGHTFAQAGTEPFHVKVAGLLGNAADDGTATVTAAPPAPAGPLAPAPTPPAGPDPGAAPAPAPAAEATGSPAAPVAPTPSAPPPPPAPAPAAADAARTPPGPPPTLGLSPPRLVGRRTLSLRLACPRAAGRCRGVARVVTLPARKRESTLRGGTTLGSALFVLGPGESKAVSIGVAARLRRVLRQARSARLAGLVIAFGSSGHNAATTGPSAVIATAGVR